LQILLQIDRLGLTCVLALYSTAGDNELFCIIHSDHLLVPEQLLGEMNCKFRAHQHHFDNPQEAACSSRDMCHGAMVQRYSKAIGTAFIAAQFHDKSLHQLLEVTRLTHGWVFAPYGTASFAHDSHEHSWEASAAPVEDRPAAVKPAFCMKTRRDIFD
jgi:hypothetical protein